MVLCVLARTRTVVGGVGVRNAREDIAPRVYGGRGEELGGAESDISVAMTGRKKGRAALYEREETPGLVDEGENGDNGEKAAARVSNPAIEMNYCARVIARDLQGVMNVRTIFEL